MKIQELFDVTGKITVITGGASGIGYAYAEVMADNGAIVTITDINKEGLDQAAAKLTARGGKVFTEIADVTDKASLKKAFDVVAHRHGRIDVVFANAGISGGPGFLDGQRNRDPQRALEALPEELWDRVMATNVKSIFSTLQVAAEHMKKTGGKIVITSSVCAFKSEQFIGTIYVTSKSAVAALVRQAAFELAKFGINVNALAPGPCATNIGGGRMQDKTSQELFNSQHLNGRIAVPDDMQGAAIYLASKASDHVIGAHILVEGGFRLGVAD